MLSMKGTHYRMMELIASPHRFPQSNQVSRQHAWGPSPSTSRHPPVRVILEGRARRFQSLGEFSINDWFSLYSIRIFLCLLLGCFFQIPSSLALHTLYVLSFESKDTFENVFSSRALIKIIRLFCCGLKVHVVRIMPCVGDIRTLFHVVKARIDS